MSKIKTFKEFINESVWSDIQDRSSGEVERKEDDVNLLDFYDGLFNYFQEHYPAKEGYDKEFDISHFPSTSQLHVFNIRIPVRKTVRGTSQFLQIIYEDTTDKIHHMIIPQVILVIYPELEKKLKKKYNYTTPANIYAYITKKSGKLTNQDCVDVLNMIMDELGPDFIRVKVS